MFEITPSGGFYDILPGYFIFFLDGMLEILFIFTSLLFLHTMKLQLSIVTGLIGCVLIGFNNIFMLLIKQSNPQLPNNNFQLSIFYPVGLVSWIIICIIIVKILISKLKENKLNNVNIKKQILELGSQYSRLELRELSEKIGEDNESLKRIVISMIRNNEIFAQYFNNTKTLVLNQQANLEQLEQLISKINTIEKKKRKKIKLFTDKVKNIKFHPILIFKILFILNILCFLVFNFYYFNLFINLPPYFFMIFGGWEGILFFLFLLRYLRLLDPKNSIRYGALGCVALGLNFPYMFYISSIYFWAFDVPLYIRTY
ncbi:MAG: PCI domain-containing protein, partial [Promethearchaeota archaeon]